MLDRITNPMLVNRNLQYINDNTTKLQKIQEQIASGKLIRIASDDPIGTTKSMYLQAELKKIAQYDKNLDDGIGYMQQTSSILSQVENILLEVKDIAESSSTEITTSAENKALSFQVNQLLEELIQFSNTKFEGKFIFGGTETLSGAKANPLPFNIQVSGSKIASIISNPAGITGVMNRIVGDGKTISVNLSGKDVFQPDGSGLPTDIFNTLIKLRENLDANDTASIRLRVGELDKQLTQVTSQNTLVGAKVNRMELIQDQLSELKLVQKEHLSSIEDTDVAEAILNLSTQQIAFQASLQTSAKILQQSLLNYI